MSLFKGVGMILLGAAYKRTLGAKSHAKARYKDRARREARPVLIGPVPLGREPKPLGHVKLRKHPASAG